MSETNTLPRLLTRAQAAEFLGVKVQTLSAWASSGRYKLPYLKVGRAVKYRTVDLQAWLDSREQTSTGQGK